MSRPERFISFEGIEGSGKSTQTRLLAQHLRTLGNEVIETAEPGGTGIGMKIRELLLDPANTMDPVTELLLYYADRAQHVSEVIYPAIKRNAFVITDRFTDSTAAYQSHARGLDISLINRLNDIVIHGIVPSLTILLDLDVEEGLRRNRAAHKQDRFELETLEFHKEVREGFHKIARKEPDRFRIIDASAEKEEIAKQVMEAVAELWH